MDAGQRPAEALGVFEVPCDHDDIETRDGRFN
jgi:hypothetical protein